MHKREIIEDGDYKVTIDYENMTTTFELSDKQHGQWIPRKTQTQAQGTG